MQNSIHINHLLLKVSCKIDDREAKHERSSLQLHVFALSQRCARLSSASISTLHVHVPADPVNGRKAKVKVVGLFCLHSLTSFGFATSTGQTDSTKERVKLPCALIEAAKRSWTRPLKTAIIFKDYGCTLDFLRS